MCVVLLEDETDELTNMHMGREHTDDKIPVQVLKLVRRGGCHTLMGKATNTDIHTCFVIYLIIIFIILIISTNYSLKLNKTSM